MLLFMTQQHRIRTDLPNTAIGPKLDANALCYVVYAMFPETWIT